MVLFIGMSPHSANSGLWPQPTDVRLCSQNHGVCQKTQDSQDLLCNPKPCELSSDDGSCSSVALPPTATSSLALVAKNLDSGLASPLCSFFLPLRIGWGSLSAVQLFIISLQATAASSITLHGQKGSFLHLRKDTKNCTPPHLSH